MKRHEKKVEALTLVELLIVVGVLALLLAVILPGLQRPTQCAPRMNCVNNLKQIGLAFKTWQLDSQNLTPMKVSYTNGGAMEMVGQPRTITSQQVGENLRGSRGVYAIFLVLSNELATPRLLKCPVEFEKRSNATTFAGVIPPGSANSVAFVSDAQVSYAIGVDASDNNPQMLLTADHNMGGNGDPPGAPYLALGPSGANSFSLGTNFTANQGPGWMDNMHRKVGNVGLADGSVQQLNRAQLQQQLMHSGDTGVVSTIPPFPLPPGSAAAVGVNRVMFP